MYPSKKIFKGLSTAKVQRAPGSISRLLRLQAYLIFGFFLLNGICIAGEAPGVGLRLERNVIEEHLDRNVEVYGRFAAVKLPITNGVRIWNPGPIRVNERGEIYAANYVGEVYRIVDTNQDGIEDSAILFCNVAEEGLRYPASLAFRGTELYVGTAQEIRVYEDRDSDGKPEKKRTLVSFPVSNDPQDWTLSLAFGKDDYLYASLSTDSYNPQPASDPQKWRGSILRISPDGKEIERYVTGIRFAPGMAFDPAGKLYFTDNEGGGNSSEELNIAVAGGFFGHNETKYPGQMATHPFLRLSTGRGVCNLSFNLRSNDFGGNAGALFATFWGMGGIAEDGAIARILIGHDAQLNVRPREVPFARIPKAYDLTFGPSGDLYVTSFGPTPALMTPSLSPTGAIYRIIEAPWMEASHASPPLHKVIRGDTQRGKTLFEERGCAQCHALDGVADLLGPNLAHLGALMNFESAVREISNPSHSIRSGFETQNFETSEGDLLTGRIITSDANSFFLMTAGNQKITLSRERIITNWTSPQSLMPENLLAGLSRTALCDLFAYLGVSEQPVRIRWRYRVPIFVLISGLLVLMTRSLRTSLYRSE